jgi:hypothetical protein
MLSLAQPLQDPRNIAVAVCVTFLIIGGVAGWLTGLGGFIERADLRDMRNSVRMKNFQYLAGGLVIAFVGDYRKIGLDREFPSVLPGACFTLAALIAYLTAIVMTQRSIRRSVDRWNENRPPRLQLDKEALLREFQSLGKPAFDMKFKADTEALHQQEQRDQEQERQQAQLRKREEAARNSRRARHTEANRAVAACVTGVLYFRDRDRTDLLDAILDAACAVVRAHAERPDEIELAASLMRFVSDAEASDQMRQEALFTFDSASGRYKAMDRGRYFGFLELIHGARHASGQKVVLPVETVATAQNLVLPGAPFAARGGSIATFNTRPLEADLALPEACRRDMEAFFQDSKFASVGSLAIIGGHAIVGVLNIESSERDMLAHDENARRAAFASLLPVAALLSKFLNNRGDAS